MISSSLFHITIYILKSRTGIFQIRQEKSAKIWIEFLIEPANLAFDVLFKDPSAVFCHQLCLLDAFIWNYVFVMSYAIDYSYEDFC